MTGAFIVRKLTQNVSKVGGLIAAAGIALAGVAEAQQVGTAAAVNPAAQVRGSSGSRTIVIGQSIAHRERIRTTSAGSVQLLFLDKTSMTIGPNSDLAIDEYVYDPGSNTGKLAATLTKGVMRFVGGQISHAGNAQITTPNAVVGIRGGVGIFSPNSVYIGYGEGNVRSGSSSVTLTAGDYTRTLGGGAPPTNPSPPPSGFLQSVLAMLQSQGGQGGGARATAGQVNQARTAASGSSTGNIASNVQNTANQTINNTSQTNAASSINQTIQTTANQTRIERTAHDVSNEPLIAFTGGLVSSTFGPIIAALGSGFVQQDDMHFYTAGVDSIASGNYTGPSNEFDDAYHRFGPDKASVNVHSLATGASVLLPATSPGGGPAATVNGQAVSQFSGGVVEFKPGSAISQAASQQLQTTFCQCEYTRWGLWAATTTRPDPNVSGGQITDTAEMFWVAGRMPLNASDIPTNGIATYVGHAIANIQDTQNGGLPHVYAGTFQNTVNFATRTGNVSINGLDSTNYTGTVSFPNGSPVFLTANGGLAGSNPDRSLFLIGSFFRGRSSPVGEMGGNLWISSQSGTYGGAGIFAGKMQ